MLRVLAGLTVLLAAAGPAGGATPSSATVTGFAERGQITALVKVEGGVVAEEVFRLKSSIEGRVETVEASSYAWSGPDGLLATVASKELVAILDSRATTPSAVLEDRWQPVYQATPIRCPVECFVLRVFAREKRWVQPEAILIEAARKLRLVGRVRPGDSHWIKDGQLLTFWAKKDPARRIQARVERFVLDVQGERADPGGTFTALLDSRRYLDPGTEWAGEITALVRKDALKVPTAALIEHEGELYLPVRVSTGITTYDFTEVRAGASERSKYLILDPSKLGSYKPYRPKFIPAEEKLWRRRQRRSYDPEPDEDDKGPQDGDYPSDIQ